MHWRAESLLVDEGVKGLVANKELRDLAAQKTIDTISNNVSAENIGRVVGRAVTGIVLAPAGALAAIGDGTRAVERGSATLEDILKASIFGN